MYLYFLISPWKLILWVLSRSGSVRWFLWVPTCFSGVHFHSFSSFSPVRLFHLLYYLFYLPFPFLGDDTKWPTRVDVSLNPNTVNDGEIRKIFTWYPSYLDSLNRPNALIRLCSFKNAQADLSFPCLYKAQRHVFAWHSLYVKMLIVKQLASNEFYETALWRVS